MHRAGKDQGSAKSRITVEIKPNPAATGWNFHERLDRGNGAITHWIEKEKISIRAQASLERMIDQLRPLDAQQWVKPRASLIADHTYVIRFKDVGNVQLRIYGHFYSQHHAFVMTNNGVEKDGTYYPKDYKKVALQYKSICDADFPGKTRKFRNHCKICQDTQRK